MNCPDWMLSPEYERQVVTAWSCNFQLNFYPFGTQRCTMVIYTVEPEIFIYPDTVKYTGADSVYKLYQIYLSQARWIWTSTLLLKCDTVSRQMWTRRTTIFTKDWSLNSFCGNLSREIFSHKYCPPPYLSWSGSNNENKIIIKYKITLILAKLWSRLLTIMSTWWWRSIWQSSSLWPRCKFCRQVEHDCLNSDTKFHGNIIVTAANCSNQDDWYLDVIHDDVSLHWGHAPVIPAGSRQLSNMEGQSIRKGEILILHYKVVGVIPATNRIVHNSVQILPISEGWINIALNYVLPFTGVTFTAAFMLYGFFNHYTYTSECDNLSTQFKWSD